MTDSYPECKDCYYFFEHEHYADRYRVYQGYCRRYPQAVSKDVNDFCGEWNCKELGEHPMTDSYPECKDCEQILRMFGFPEIRKKND